MPNRRHCIIRTKYVHISTPRRSFMMKHGKQICCQQNNWWYFDYPKIQYSPWSYKIYVHFVLQRKQSQIISFSSRPLVHINLKITWMFLITICVVFVDSRFYKSVGLILKKSLLVLEQKHLSRKRTSNYIPQIWWVWLLIHTKYTCYWHTSPDISMVKRARTDIASN